MTPEDLAAIAESFAEAAPQILRHAKDASGQGITDMKVLHGTKVQAMADETLRLFLADLTKKLDRAIKAKRRDTKRKR